MNIIDFMLARKGRYHYFTYCNAHQIGNLDFSAYFDGEKDVNLHVSIPFCIDKCGYCTLVTVRNSKVVAIDKYLNYLGKEFSFMSRDFKLDEKNITTLSIGGGTPSLLSENQLEKLLKMCHKFFNINEAKEINFEIAPFTCSNAKLRVLKDHGISRLSFGVQSFSDKILQMCNRRHDMCKLISAIEDAKKLKFPHINIDLMYGLPKQNLDEIKMSLEMALSLEPTELCYYFLEDSLLSRKMMFERIRHHLPDENKKLQFYRYISERLKQKQYLQLGKTFFSRDHYFSLYQMARLRNANILGMGLGGWSMFDNMRIYSFKYLDKYYDRIERDKLPWQCCFMPSKQELMLSDIVSNLHLLKLDKAYYNKKFNINFDRYFSKEIFLLKKKHFIWESTDFVYVTAEGTAYLEQIQDTLAYGRIYHSQAIRAICRMFRLGIGGS